MTDQKLPQHIVAACCLVTNAKGEILLMQHPRRGWEVPGGQVEEGESLFDALRREIEEETGIIASIGQLAGIYSNLKPPCKVIFGFLGSTAGGELHTSAESPTVEWVPRGEVLKRVTHPALHDRTQDLLDFSGRIVYRVYTTDPYQVLEVSYLGGETAG